MSGITIVKNRVLSDSVLFGLPVVIIESTSDVDATTDMNPSPDMTMKGTTKMTTTARNYYSPAYRITIMQTATGTGTSTQNIEGPVSMSMSGASKTENSMKLLRK